MSASGFSPSAACADFVAGLRWEDLPDPVIDQAKKDLLDWFGCAIAGSRDPAAGPFRRVSGHLDGAPKAGLIGSGPRGAVAAAMGNAWYGHILEMDDVDRESISHPATVNLPPALAAAEARGKSGREALLGMIAGFEVMLRVGAAVTPAHYQVFHTTATSGVFGAAMAAGKALGLERQRLLWALGNAGTMSCGLWQFLPDGGMSKFLHTAAAAGNGLLVSLLAAEGFSGATHILEGKQGFFAGYARQEVDFDLFRDFGERWRTLSVSFKPYPCCRHTHSAIDAAAEIRRQAAGRALSRIRLFTYGAAMQVAGGRAPADARQAKFSVSYCVASTLLRGLPGDDSFSAESVRQAEVVALEKKIEMVVDPQLDASAPSHWPCRIEAETADGAELVAQIWDPTGDPENALSWEGASDKFRLLTGRSLPAAAQDRVIELCRRIDELSDPGQIIAAINEALVPG